MAKTPVFKASTVEGIMTVPYRDSFRLFGEQFVIHRCLDWHKSLKRWVCSHFGTGMTLSRHLAPSPSVPECRWQAEKFLKERGERAVKAKIEEEQPLNLEGMEFRWGPGKLLVIESLFD